MPVHFPDGFLIDCWGGWGRGLRLLSGIILGVLLGNSPVSDLARCVYHIYICDLCGERGASERRGVASVGAEENTHIVWSFWRAAFHIVAVAVAVAVIVFPVPLGPGMGREAVGAGFTQVGCVVAGTGHGGGGGGGGGREGCCVLRPCRLYAGTDGCGLWPARAMALISIPRPQHPPFLWMGQRDGRGQLAVSCREQTTNCPSLASPCNRPRSVPFRPMARF